MKPQPKPAPVAGHTQWFVDGHMFDDPDSDLQGDGQFAPFWVFDPENQRYVAGPFDKRDDAALIASAPELLAALKLEQHFRCHAFCTQSLDLFRAHGYNGTDKSTEMQRWLGNIHDAAIARAEGRT